MIQRVITMISNKITEDNPSVVKLAGSEPTQLELCYDSARSVGEEAIILQKGSASIYVMGPEYNNQMDFMSPLTLPQTIQCGCDITTHLIGKLGLDTSTTVVPVFCANEEGISVHLIFHRTVLSCSLLSYNLHCQGIVARLVSGCMPWFEMLLLCLARMIQLRLRLQQTCEMPNFPWIVFS